MIWDSSSLGVGSVKRRDKESEMVEHKGLLAENYFNYATKSDIEKLRSEW